MTYQPPVQDMLFVLQNVVGLDGLPQSGDLDADTVGAILDEAAKLAAGVLAPLYRTGDEVGCTLHDDGRVTTPPGFKDAYKQYAQGGWNAVPFNPDHGGQGLPWVLGFAIQEMWQGANMGFGLCPMLNQAAVEAIENHGSPEQQSEYLEKLISGEWAGTMNLTEPHAGTDLGAIKTKAEKQADGSYLLKGQKIFITYGDHDFTDNIIHMVLARTPDAPEGIKGISMFIVPKMLADGTRNDLHCGKLEEKLGIHASPTCVMYYGDKGGAKAYLIGQENEGIKYMFTMMNNARLSVGLQGVALAEASYQHALDYARMRVQGTPVGGAKDAARVPIIEHEDIRRSLLSMKSQVEAARLLTYEAAKMFDLGRTGDAAAQARMDLLTPIVKAWCTDMAVEVTSTGLQIHGGMGFIEETGAAQYYRDARILPIYEGANGIHGLDLTFRKILMNKGVAASSWFDEIDATSAKLTAYAPAQKVLRDSVSSLRAATQALMADTPQNIAAVATPYLRAFGLISGAAMMARALVAADALAEAGGDQSFCTTKRATALFYMHNILPLCAGELAVVAGGQSTVVDFKPAQF
ncbi:MAG: acyl-CoA dehydrogenase [Alphaproteobacteria bacterium]|nr:acyl-CoA dehydrogenase [Alphaproteobacteria bacterium]